jgi:hypothetical protein
VREIAGHAVVPGTGGPAAITWETGVIVGLADAGIDLCGPVMSTPAS